MIRINLAKLLEEKDITQNRFFEMTNIRPGTINAYFHGFVKRMNVKDINIICEVLECDVSDLIQYIPKKKNAQG